MVFDANFSAVDTITANDTVILYAAGLGPTDDSGQVIDPIEVYIGERQAQVQFAGLAPGFPGIYQLNVIAPVPAADRLYLRSGGWQSNITGVGIRSGANVTNVAGRVEPLYPSTDPSFKITSCTGGDPDSAPPIPPVTCVVGEPYSIMLHVGTFGVSLYINPSAKPFDVAAVGVGGASIISIDPAAGTFTASVSTIAAPTRSMEKLLPGPSGLVATAPDAVVQVSEKRTGCGWSLTIKTTRLSRNSAVLFRFRSAPSGRACPRSSCKSTAGWWIPKRLPTMWFTAGRR